MVLREDVGRHNAVDKVVGWAVRQRRLPLRGHLLVNYLKVHRRHVQTVFDTLGCVDGVNFATRARCPALFSVALMDATCPPSTVFGAYHHYRGPRRIEVYPFNGHEGGESVQTAARLRFLAEALSPASGLGAAYGSSQHTCAELPGPARRSTVRSS